MPDDKYNYASHFFLAMSQIKYINIIIFLNICTAGSWRTLVQKINISCTVSS